MKEQNERDPLVGQTGRGHNGGTLLKHLCCEYEVDPLGIGARQPRLSWILESSARGQRQTAYQIQVASSAERLVAGEFDVWDSGRVCSRQAVHVAYAGRALRSRERCWWRVTVWDKDDIPVTSDSAWWEMGLLEEAEWSSPWITLTLPDAEEQPGAGQHLRTRFNLEKPIRQARLYATALGVYEAYLNGCRVGDHVFAPGWTQYHIRVMVQTYDVSALLRSGPNALGVLLGEGWYCGHVGMAGRACYGSTRPAFRAQLILDYEDGTREVIGTGSWARPMTRAGNCPAGTRQTMTTRRGRLSRCGRRRRGWWPRSGHRYGACRRWPPSR